jgi:hypothetical protein
MFRCRFQRVGGRAGHAPRQTCRCKIEFDFTTERLSHHRIDHNGAEASPFRRSYGRTMALSPAHREEIAVNLPTDIDVAGVRRESADLQALVSSSWSARPIA